MFGFQIGRKDPANDTRQAAEKELAEAKSLLMQAQSAEEWAQSQVAYNAKRVERLTAMLEAMPVAPHRHAVPKEPTSKVEIGSIKGDNFDITKFKAYSGMAGAR